MDPFLSLMIYIAAALIGLALFITVMRAVFRVNHICETLEKIEQHLRPKAEEKMDEAKSA